MKTAGTHIRLSKLTLEDFPQWGKVGEGWGKTLDMVLRVSPYFPLFPPQGKCSKDQICATLLIKMKVFNTYKASPTGVKWGEMGEGRGRGLKLFSIEF